MFLLSLTQVSGQKIYESYSKLNGSVRYGDGKDDFFPYTYKGYRLILPNIGADITGIILMLDDNKIASQDTTKKQYIHIESEANAKGFAVLSISTGIPVDYYFSKSSLAYVDTTLGNVLAKYHLINKNIFLLGAMVSGYRALKYIEFCKTGKFKLQT